MRAFVPTLAVALLASAATAQTSKLYMQDAEPYNDYNTQVRVAQGGTVNQTFNLNSAQEHNLVVAGDIRTYAGDHSGTPGYQYDTNGTYQGVQYNNVGGCYYGGDAATDGVNNNWVWDYGYSAVFRYDHDYQNGSYAFSLGGGIGGITYDQDNGTLWTFSANSNEIRQSDTSGNYISSFTDGNMNGTYQALAMDPADDTLWLLQGRGNGNAWLQYNRSGQLLSSGNFNMSINTGSAEFDMNAVPAPGAAALLGVSGLVAARRRRA